MTAPVLPRHQYNCLTTRCLVRNSSIAFACLILASVGIQLQVFRTTVISKTIGLDIQQYWFAMGGVPKETPKAPNENRSLRTNFSSVPFVRNNSIPNDTKERTEGLAIIMFSHLATAERFRNLFFPAVETWWQNETEPLYIVLANRWKAAYQELCHDHNCSQFYPLWVDCPESIFGESPCCKQEKGLLALPKSYEWTLFADDDMYFKTGTLRRYLTHILAIDPAETYLITAAGVSAKFLGQWGYVGTRGLYQCSALDDFRYPWGQPVIYSRAALNLITPGLRAGGLVKQCLEFQVTHDVGNAIFHWMYQIPDYSIKVHMFPNNVVASEAFGVHGIHRFIKKMNRTVTMKDVHMQALNRTATGFKRYMRTRHQRKGFLETDTFARFGDPSTWGHEWHTMPVRDCMDRAMRQKSDSDS
jgi:hypothetical protein